jgi:hypothetical protein
MSLDGEPGVNKKAGDRPGQQNFSRVGPAVLAPAGFLMGFGFPTGMRLVSAISTGPTPWFWGINGAAGVLAASVAVVISIAFSIDTTLRIGAACYLLIAAPAVLLVFAGARPSRTVLRSLHPSKAANV